MLKSRNFFIKVFLLFFSGIISTPLFAQKIDKFDIAGFIKDSTNGETLLGAAVYVEEIAKGSNTNDFGHYSLSLPSGIYHLKCSYIGFKTKLITVNLTKDVALNFDMIPSAIQTKEVEVTAVRKDANVTSTSVGRQEISVETAKSIPAFLGEVDILKTLQLLPGVMASGEGNTGFYVRGGGPDQNLVLLDQATVYNSGHLFGFFSVFNADAVKNVTIEKGTIPAEYGGRISSVIDVKMKEGNMKKWQVDGGIGLIASRLTVQGPLKKDKCSIIVSGRRTYIDLITKPLLKNMAKGQFAGNSYYFYDLNAKINYKISEKDRIYLSGYFGRDVFNFKDNTSGFGLYFPWGNSTVTTRWNHVFDPKLFMNAIVMYNDYRFNANASFRDVRFNVNSSVKEISAKMDFDYSPLIGHFMKFGLHYNYHIFTPYQAAGFADSVSFTNTNASKKYAHETAIYFQDEFDISKKVKVNFGVRASMFNLVGPYTKVEYSSTGTILDTLKFGAEKPIKTYWGIEPRLSLRYQVAKSTSIKAGFSSNRQYIHLVSSSTTSLPFDLWVPSSLKVKPQIAVQGSLGIYQNFKNDMIETYIEGYYKHLWNQIEYGQSAVQNISVDVEDLFTYGKGWSYGTEFFVKKAKGRWTGWIGYTLAWSKRKFPNLNNGETFNAKYDRRHDLNLVFMYQVTKRWKVSATFVYATGNTTTLPQEIYFVNGNIHYLYGKRNDYRLPAYHRLDIGATYSIPSKRKWFSSDINFSVYNTYNRQNPYFIYIDVRGNATKGNQRVVLRQTSLFPILPSITWNFKFL